MPTTVHIAGATNPPPARPLAQQHSSDDRITSADVRRMLGISGVTLWRWTNDPSLNFPKPDDIIYRRRFWYRSTVTGWLADRDAKQGTA
ncbi:MAG TPA: hypothetical protein VFC56_12625 [Stellaceae bacterium]|nr:hypothetical protein [Stellaceae bacterium]